MYGFEGLGLSEVQLSISELSVVGGWTGQTHFMVGPGRGPTKMILEFQYSHVTLLPINIFLPCGLVKNNS